jgi:hypothetical protein
MNMSEVEFVDYTRLVKQWEACKDDRERERLRRDIDAFASKIRFRETARQVIFLIIGSCAIWAVAYFALRGTL